MINGFKTTEDFLNDAKIKLAREQDHVNGLEACLFLENLWETATYKNTIMAPYNDGKIVNKCFKGLEIDYYAKNNILLKYIKSQAKHVKDVCDTEAWPEWKQEAYKNAKIYQEYFNKYIRLT